MSVIWAKVWFDLWQNRGRTALAVLSIAAGVFAVGSIFGLVDQLLRGMDGAHQAVAPSHANIILRDAVDIDTVNALKNVDGIVDIDPVNQISVRYRLDGDEAWSLGTLVMRPDFDDQTYDIVVLQEGAWPGDNAIGIERLSSQYFGAGIGDEILFDINGRQVAYPVNGLIRHPFVQPPPFGGQAHFFADGRILANFGVPEGDYGQLLVRVDPYSEEHAREVAGDIRAALANRGFGVAVTLYQEPEKHWGRPFVEGINLVLQIMAVTSLFMSTILILNSLTAIITQQTDQIGVIKAVGGRRRTIVKVYLAGVLVYSTLGLLIALPLAVVFAFVMSRWFLNLFNIDYTAFQASVPAVVLMVLSAIVAPLLAGLWPVLKGSAITVCEALATYGLGADFGSSRFDLLVDRLGARFLPTTYAAALGNMFRRKGRLALTLLVLVVAGVMFLVVMSLISSTILTLDNEVARQNYDVRIGFTTDHPPFTILDALEGHPDAQAAEVWYSRNATLLRQGERLQDSTGLGAQLVGLPAGSDMIRPLIAGGRWLAPGDKAVVVISQETAEKYNITPGDTLTLDLGELGSADWQVVGTYRVVYDAGFVTEPIYAPLETVYQATGQPDTGSQVLVRTGTATLAESSAAADRLKTALRQAGLDINFYTTAVKLEQRQYADNQFGSVTSMLVSLAMLVATVGGIGLMGALGISVVERTREIGVMRATGARSRTIMSLFIMEGMLQGLLSWLITLPIAFVAARPLARLLGQTMVEVDLDFAFNWPAVVAWLAITVVIALLAAVLPARRASRISVRESLAYA